MASLHTQLPTVQCLSIILGNLCTIHLQHLVDKHIAEACSYDSKQRTALEQGLLGKCKPCRPTKVARELSNSIAHRRMGLPHNLLRGSSAERTKTRARHRHARSHYATPLKQSGRASNSTTRRPLHEHNTEHGGQTRRTKTMHLRTTTWARRQELRRQTHGLARNSLACVSRGRKQD